MIARGPPMVAKLRAPGLLPRFPCLSCCGIPFALATDMARAHVHRARHLPPLHRRRSDPDGLADRLPDLSSWSGSAASTTGSTGPRASPTRPEDHSGHGATSWKDYFRINTDHKVIGVQYTVTSFFFLLVGGLLAMLMRAQLAQPGAQFVDANTYNGLFSVHASLLIFLFVIPVFAGLANFVLPLMIGAPDMAFPRLNALSYWLLPLAGADDALQLPRSRRRLRRRLDRLHAAVDQRARSARTSSRSACSSRAPPRS